MIFTPLDWKTLRNPILALGFTLVIFGLLAYYSNDYQQQQANALIEEQANLNKARQQYLSSGHEKETITRYLPIYQSLVKDGFIGEEQRIEWIETLRTIHQNAKLFGIEYDIGEQSRVKPAYLEGSSNVHLQRSTMRISLGLLHEGDLLALLKGLQENSKNFIVKSCEIQRQNNEINLTNINENMTAKCDVDWFTIRDPQLRHTS
jgi:hypothetical protein